MVARVWCLMPAPTLSPPYLPIRRAPVGLAISRRAPAEVVRRRKRVVPLAAVRVPCIVRHHPVHFEAVGDLAGQR